MPVGELVKEQAHCDSDGETDQTEDADDCRDRFVFLRDEEDHVCGYRKLRHLQSHRDDHAKDGAADENERPHFALVRRRQLAPQPIKPARAGRLRIRERRAHQLFPWRTLDDRHRRSTHAEQIGVRILHFDAHWKSLGNVNPVQLPFYIRHSAEWQIDLALGHDRPADSLHLSNEMAIGRGEQINIHRSARREMADFAFAEIRDDIPISRVQQREHRNTGAGIGSDGDVQVDDATWKRRGDFAIGKFKRGKVNGGDRARTLGHKRRQGAYGCVGLVQTLLSPASEAAATCLAVRALSTSSAVVNPLGRSGSRRCNVLLGLIEFDFCLFHSRFRRLDLELQVGVLSASHFDLPVQRCQISLGLFQGYFVIVGINLEQYVSRLDLLVVLHIQFDDLAGRARDNAHDIRASNGIVGARMPFRNVPDPERQHDRAKNHSDAYNLAGNLAPSCFWEMLLPMPRRDLAA